MWHDPTSPTDAYLDQGAIVDGLSAFDNRAATLRSACPPGRIRSASNCTPPLDRQSALPRLAFTHVKGHRAIQAVRPALTTLAVDHGQSDSVEDLAYFLEKPGLMRRAPHLIMMRDLSKAPPATREHHGALLIHEFRPFGIPTGTFATTDRSGRGVVFGEPQDRLRYALHASDMLLSRGARMVMITVQCEEAHSIADWGRPVRGVQWAVRSRHQPCHLKLENTYEATLAKLGQKTRANLRYYRRRAETGLKCRFLPQVSPSIKELLQFNRDSSFPLSRRVLGWRLQVHSRLQAPYMAGLQDGGGRWLSLIAGRRFGDSTEILWQLNRGQLPGHSIVSAMRSFWMEHEIGQGMKRFFVEGGTNHSMQNSFELVPTTDLIMIRSRLKAGMRSFAKRYVPPDNILAEMLSDSTSHWYTN